MWEVSTLAGGGRALGGGAPDAGGADRHWARCNPFAENGVVDGCSADRGDRSLLCVVETPGDQLMIEQTLTYRGLYFVLMGWPPPLDGF